MRLVGSARAVGGHRRAIGICRVEHEEFAVDCLGRAHGERCADVGPGQRCFGWRSLIENRVRAGEEILVAARVHGEHREFGEAARSPVGELEEHGRARTALAHTAEPSRTRRR